MDIANLKKVAELILLKDKEYCENDKLKHYLKKYIALKNDICILEETLADMQKNPDLCKKYSEELDSEIKRYFNILDGLESQLVILNSKFQLKNYTTLEKCVNNLRNIKITSAKYDIHDIYSRLTKLYSDLEIVEWNLELIILNYGLKNFEVDKKYKCQNNNLLDHICGKIMDYLEDNPHDSENRDTINNND